MPSALSAVWPLSRSSPQYWPQAREQAGDKQSTFHFKPKAAGSSWFEIKKLKICYFSAVHGCFCFPNCYHAIEGNTARESNLLLYFKFHFRSELTDLDESDRWLNSTPQGRQFRLKRDLGDGTISCLSSVSGRGIPCALHRKAELSASDGAGPQGGSPAWGACYITGECQTKLGSRRRQTWRECQESADLKITRNLRHSHC